jgi:predicted ATPase
VSGTAFARRAIELAIADRVAASRPEGWVFFDRRLVDAAAALEHLTGEPALATLGGARIATISACSSRRLGRKSMLKTQSGAAVAEHERLVEAYASLSYELLMKRSRTLGVLPPPERGR